MTQQQPISPPAGLEQPTQDQLIQELQTVRDYVRWAASRFGAAQIYFGHGTDNAWDEAIYLVFGALNLPWNTDPAVLDARVTQPERQRLLSLIERRAIERVPVAYLINQAWFAGLPFFVDERVLIPRSPIAEIIDGGFSPWIVGDELQSILDLCTGSGCIGIACAVAFPHAQVDLSDISEAALAIANINIQRHQLQGRVQAIESDLFAGLAGQRYDLIVSNPPYVDHGDFTSMPAEFRHEPAMALAAGADGLDAAIAILAAAGEHLNEYGVLVVEVGNSQTALEATFPGVPFLWLDFEHGGHGVFVLTAGQLQQHQQRFLAAHEARVARAGNNPSRTH